MIDLINTYLYLLFFSSILLFIIAFYVWKTYLNRNELVPAKYFAFFLSLGGIWSLCSGLALWSNSEQITYFFEQLKYVGIVFIAPTWLLIISSWTSKDKWLNWKTITYLYIPSSVILSLILTNDFHNLFWTTTDYQIYNSFLTSNFVHGPLWWLLWGYSYILLIIGTSFLIKNVLRLHSFYKKQSILLVIGLFIPWIANVLYGLSMNNTFFGSIDITPIAFVFTGFVYIYGFTNFKLINMFPVSKETVFNNLQDPVVVFDSNKLVIDLNDIAKKDLQLNSKQIIGKKVSEVFSDYPEIINAFNNFDNQNSFEVKIDDYRKSRFFDVTFSKVTEKNQPQGYILSFRDITQRKYVNNALRESEMKFRTFTESTSIAIMIFQNNHWIYANPSAEQITGYSKDELLEMNFWEFTHPDYKEYIFQRVKAYQEGDNQFPPLECKIVTKQRNEKWIDLNTKIITISGKRAILATATDITKQKKSTKTINKQLTAIKSSMDGIAILNQKGEYEYINNAHASIYGYDSSNNLIGKSWRSLYNEKELERFDREIMPDFRQYGQWRGEAVGKKKDGTTFDQEITLTAIEDGVICVVRDITKQKMMIRELEDAHELLFIINKDLKRKVKQRTEEIERLVKQKDDFINQLGHDLKTPLTPMMVLLPILKEKVDTEKDIELFDVIIRNVYFMKDLVNKTIDLAKLNTDKIKFSMEKVQLAHEINEVLTNNQVLFEENNIQVSADVDSSIEIIGDKLRMQEVFNNLLTNAIKYTKEEGGMITITAEETGSDKITVSISDTGIGMTDEQQSHMFDEFYKADESRHNLDSSGLGLSITKKIIEKHGGKIWAESEGPGKGSTFYFTLTKTSAKKRIQDISSSE